MARDDQAFGVHRGTVVDNIDPTGLGRIRVAIPQVVVDYSGWCRLITPMAGAGRGVWFIPEVGDEVAVLFEAGDIERPYVIGGLWNDIDAPPPEQMDRDGENNIRSVRSRSGITITMDDSVDMEVLVLETPAGHRLELHDGDTRITVEGASGDRIILDSSGITLESSSVVNVTASTVDITAGSVSVEAGLTTFSGVVKADTVITNSVVASSYTPGAGNIW